ncbi:MAG: DUF3109 family protein [Bacteroidales bacterium]|nr:DUF3109 family protein [Bacteroidales bacterium]
MFAIQDTLVSEDLLREAFCCDLHKCKGACCNSEGESGAPLDEDELEVMRAMVEVVWDELTPRAQQVIREKGPFFKDAAGDWTTSVVDGRDCVFCTYPSDAECEAAHVPAGSCLCAIEKAFREGRFQTHPAYREGKVPFLKPISCHLYPVRLKQLGDYLAVNYDEQPEMCGCAVRNGRRLRVRLYQCLRDALIRRFGAEWYEALCLCARELEKANML